MPKNPLRRGGGRKKWNKVTKSCIVSQIVPLNVDKDGRMFCGGFLLRNLYPMTLTAVIALPGF